MPKPNKTEHPDPLHGVDDVNVRDKPIPVGVGVFVGPFERISAQVENFWGPQANERLQPALQHLRPLFHQHHFPVLHANGNDFSVVTDVEEELPGASADEPRRSQSAASPKLRVRDRRGNEAFDAAVGLVPSDDLAKIVYSTPPGGVALSMSPGGVTLASHRKTP